MNIYQKIIPPSGWRIPVMITLAVVIGLIAYLVYVSNAPSYLSDKPKTCVNCHIMAPQYATWSHSSHREAAHCNDCHVPHHNVFSKYYFKAKDGLRHATVFTLRNEPQVIFIKEEGREAVQENCVRCHAALLKDTPDLSMNAVSRHFRTERPCWECHREVPHGRINSISSAPDARVPLPPSPVPDWLNQLTK